MVSKCFWTGKNIVGQVEIRNSGLGNCGLVKIKIKAYQIVLSLAHNEVRLAWPDGGFDFK